jgi:hypothetical protein
MPAQGADEHPIIVDDLPDLNQPTVIPVNDNSVQDVVVQPVDPINTLQQFIESDVPNSDDILPGIGSVKIVGTSCSLIEMEENGRMVKKIILQISTVDKSESLVDLGETAVIPVVDAIENPPKNKRKNKEPMDIGPVRRSVRIAKKLGGYKDVASATAAGYIPLPDDEDFEAEFAVEVLAKDLTPRFDAVAHDVDAPPPPHLPLETVQAIGTGMCQMPREAVSEAVLLYDSSNDSV